MRQFPQSIIILAIFKQFVLVVSFSFFFALTSIAQTDSLKIEYAEEPSNKSDYTFKEKYRYFTRALIEEKTLFKTGVGAKLYGFEDSKDGGLVMNQELILKIGVERKISPSFSFLIQSEYYANAEDIKLNLGGRYYHALKRRIKEGKGANNFSANYFALQWNDPVNLGKTDPSGPHIFLGYGFQRRLGKYFYLDASGGPGFQTELSQFIFHWNFSFGVGL